MERKHLKIGLFGFGCVGYGLYEVLEKTPGMQARIAKICIKDPLKPRPLPQERFTFDANDILKDDSINVVVELIDDADAAFHIVREALQRGKAVVTANKKMIAEHLPELLELQRVYGSPLLYEAACCASIPIIRNLEEYYDNDMLQSIEGIVNGSTNYILTKTGRDHLSYADALAQAQLSGYAESDPALDTQGFDAKYKLLILLAHAFGMVVAPGDVFHSGIEQLGELELKYAREKNFKIKLVAHARKQEDGRISAYVLPRFIRPEEKLYWVDEVFNGIQTQSCFSDAQFFVGKGAGAYPTASAVLSDLSALRYDYRYEYKKLMQQEAPGLSENESLQVFVRHSKCDTESIQAEFSEIREVFLNGCAAYLIGNIPLKGLRLLEERASEPISCILCPN